MHVQRIRDTDFASETAALTGNQIIQQASQSILSQANQRPTVALNLLGGRYGSNTEFSFLISLKAVHNNGLI